jgi:pimeloyl-ACP methyl ester carboxylesterase
MAEALLLVPGLNCTAELFRPQVEVFSSEREVIIADHRQDDRIEAMAKRALDAAPARFALGGLSMGGYVALAMQRMAPERVTRLALLDTTARPDTAEGTERRRTLMALAREGRFDEVHQALWPRLVHPNRFGDKALDAIVRQMMHDTGVEAFCRQQEAIIHRVDSRPLLPSVRCPTLVAVGAQDAITPIEMAEEIVDAIPGAVLAIIPETGHLATIEAPVHLNAALAKWLMR